MKRSSVAVYDRENAAGKTVYYIQWLSPENGKWKTQTIGTDKRKADKEAARKEDEIAQGTYFEPKDMTWEEYGQQLLSVTPDGQHRNCIKEIVNRFGNFIGNVQIGTIKRPVVKQYLKSIQDRGRAEATVNRHHRYICLILNNAVEDGALRINPIAKMRKIKEPERDIRVISKDEEKNILSKVEDEKGDQWATYITLMLQTGGRRDEIIATAWADYTIDDKVPVVKYLHTKARKIRRLKLTPETIHLLRKLQIKFGQRPGPFSDWVGHKATKQWGYLSRKHGFGVTLHDFRRTCITRWLLAGVTLPVVQRMAGHTDINTTIRYYSAIPSAEMERAIDATRERLIG